MNFTVYLHWNDKVATLTLDGTMTGADFRDYLSTWSNDTFFAKENTNIILMLGSKDLDMEKQLTQQCMTNSCTIRCCIVCSQHTLQYAEAKNATSEAPVAAVRAYNAPVVELVKRLF